MRFFILSWLFISGLICGQISTYYSGINFDQSKAQVQLQLSNLVKNTHNTKLSYTPDVWYALKEIDYNPQNPNDVLLMYGSNDNDQVLINDRSRDKDKTCHEKTCSGRWNREHVFPKSVGEFEENGYAYTDIHALRAADTEMNSLRYNYPFADGIGEAHKVSAYKFYPGDEWKGDVARMILYMYLRYPNKCKPKYVGIDTYTYNANIPDIFLEWNAEDPVSEFEINRNNLIAKTYQGNRNPFIDNPYIATLLWGGPMAEKTWDVLSIQEIQPLAFKFYPNPTKAEIYYQSDNLSAVKVYNMAGKLLSIDSNLSDNKTVLPREKGIYLVEFCKDNSCKSYKVIKN